MARQNKSKSLDRRLKVYAATAAGTLALVPPASAAIHYTKADPPIVVDNSNNLYSLSMDGIPGHGFEFKYLNTTLTCSTTTTTTTPCLPSKLQGLVIRPGSVSAEWFLNEHKFPANLETGQLVSANAPYGFANNLNMFLNAAWAFPSDTFLLGEFSENKHGYLGVRFQTDGRQLYGWIEYEGKAAESGTIKGWAYEDSGKAIRAGQKPAAVPTFTELGIYLFAALLILGGMLASKAKRESSQDA